MPRGDGPLSRQLDFCEDGIEVGQHIFNMFVPVEVNGGCFQQFIHFFQNIVVLRQGQTHLFSPEAVFIGQKEEIYAYVSFVQLGIARFLRNGMYQEPFGI